MTMRIKPTRSINSLAIHALDGQTNLSAVVQQTSLFVQIGTLSDPSKVAIEKALLKAPACFPYIETISKTFLIQAGQNSFIRESIFGTEPIRRLTLCLIPNENFRGKIGSKVFRYEKYGLQRVEILRGNGIPIGGTPLDTTNNVRAYYNTMTAIGFKNGGHVYL